MQPVAYAETFFWAMGTALSNISVVIKRSYIMNKRNLF